MPRNVSFSVAPRYTPGSPGLVDEETALRVASQEKETYEVAAEGAYGVDFQRIAREKGLGGIVEKRIERGQGWDVTDLITGRLFRREITKASKIQSGDTLVEIRSGREEGKWNDFLPMDVLEARTYGREVVVTWDRMVNAPVMLNTFDHVKIERDEKE